MGEVRMLVPFSEALVTASRDGYFNGMIGAFKDAGHEARLAYASANVAWSTTKPAGEAAFVTSVKESQALLDVFHRTPSNPSGMAYYSSGVTAGGSQALARVDPLDMLYLIGHSSYQGGYLVLKSLRLERNYFSANRLVLDRRWLRVDHLAELLMREGLPRGHRYIKLNSCYGGGSDASDRALAKDLAIQLKKRGYAKIKVGGYQYLTSVSPGKISITAPFVTKRENRTWSDNEDVAVLTNTFSKANNPPAEDLMYERDPYRCWYDGAGTLVRWNVPDNYYERSGDDGMFGGRWTAEQIGILHPDDPGYAKWRQKKLDEAAWIAAMERVTAPRR